MEEGTAPQEHTVCVCTPLKKSDEPSEDAGITFHNGYVIA